MRDNEIESMILSTEKNSVVTHRAKKLGIECHNGCEDKMLELNKIVRQKGIQLNEVVFVGNDINDLECLKNVGLPIVVADAYEEVKAVAKIILHKKGGEGAVREVCELITNKKNIEQYEKSVRS